VLSRKFLIIFLTVIGQFIPCFCDGLPLFYWEHKNFINFGDYISLELVERIVQKPVRTLLTNYRKQKKLLAIGSIFSFAADNDVVWGAGINGRLLKLKHYRFAKLDIRAVRGPLTRQFLYENFSIESPEIYGDPALLFPYFFPEFKRKDNPTYDYIVIPHYSELSLFPNTKDPHVVYPTEPWNVVIEKILDSRFVIASSLHGIVIAEAYGIPARMLRVTKNEGLFKYRDYYLGTNRPYFQYATSVQEALKMGGEAPGECDLKKLYEAFPFEFWSHLNKFDARNL
jgi:pyruvyltransferase